MKTKRRQREKQNSTKTPETVINKQKKKQKVSKSKKRGLLNRWIRCVQRRAEKALEVKLPPTLLFLKLSNCSQKLLSAQDCDILVCQHAETVTKKRNEPSQNQ